MEERTFISGISDLIDNIGKCKCYDDARNLLNSFVIENVGKKYETEDGTAYRNSNNPKEIMAETLRVMDDYIRKWLIIDEAATAGFNTGRKIMDKKNVIYDDGTIISVFGNMHNDIERTKSYIEAWRKEPVPKTKKVKLFRLRPKTMGVTEISLRMFNYYLKIGKVSEESRGTWKYLCGISDNNNNAPIVWHGEWTKLCAFIVAFLCNELYFDFENGVRKHFLCEYGKEIFVKDSGEVLTEETLKGTISQAKHNGTLENEISKLEDNFGITISEKLKNKLK